VSVVRLATVNGLHGSDDPHRLSKCCAPCTSPIPLYSKSYRLGITHLKA